MVRVTSARPSGGRAEVPAKTTSSILPPRSGLTPPLPITQENPATPFDLPDPFGPTTQGVPPSNPQRVSEGGARGSRQQTPQDRSRVSETCPDCPSLGEIIGYSMTPPAQELP